MRCGGAQKLLVAAIDGELTPGRRLALDRHLAGCVACRDELAATERMLAAVDARPSEAPVSAALEQATLRRVRLAAAAEAERPERARWWRWLSLPALAAATAVVALAVGITRLTPEVRAPVAFAPATAPRPDRLARAPVPTPPARAEAPAVARRPLPPGEPPAELAAAPDKFMELPILRNLEKLEHFEAIRTTTLDDPSTPNG
jgi:anti-sigma factor RsiW